MYAWLYKTSSLVYLQQVYSIDPEEHEGRVVAIAAQFVRSLPCPLSTTRLTRGAGPLHAQSVTTTDSRYWLLHAVLITLYPTPDLPSFLASKALSKTLRSPPTTTISFWILQFKFYFHKPCAVSPCLSIQPRYTSSEVLPIFHVWLGKNWAFPTVALSIEHLVNISAIDCSFRYKL